MIIGIDLGTTNSLVAYFTEDGPEIIPNRLGKHLTPSVVSIDEEEQIYVGELAAERMLLYPESAASVFKRDMGSKKQILEKVINTHGSTQTAEVLDHVKSIGYKYSTRAAMTVSISDMTVPPEKPQLIQNAQDTVDRITKNYKRGLITEEERYKEVVETWKVTDDKLTEALLTGLDEYNNIFMMADSGARGSDKQIKQLAGMRPRCMLGLPHRISEFRNGLVLAGLCMKFLREFRKYGMDMHT